MKRRTQPIGKARLARAVGIGAASALVTVMALCMICAAAMDRGILPETSANVCALAVCIVAAAAGSAIGQALAGRAPLPVSLLCTGLMLAALGLIRTALHSGSQFTWYSLPAAGLTAVLSALVGAGRGR